MNKLTKPVKEQLLITDKNTLGSATSSPLQNPQYIVDFLFFRKLKYKYD